MTSTPNRPEVAAKPKLGKFYPLTPEVAKELRAIEQMPAGAWRLWSYLVTFDPYGSDYLELPDLIDILQECNISKATFYRAIALFTEHNLFDLQPTKLHILNLRGQRIVSKLRQPSQDCDPHSQNCETPSQDCDPQSQNCDRPNRPKPDPIGITATAPRTNNRFKELKEQQNTAKPAPHPVLDEQEKDLVPASQTTELLDLIAQAGINPNKTIQQTLINLQHQQPAAARQAVENALSAVIEQQQHGNVRNAGGMLVAALRKGFTANNAKKQARQPPSTSLNTPLNTPPSAPPPDLIQTSMSIDQALSRGDRPFAHAKLQHLYTDGWHSQIKELLQLRRDWGFRLNPNGQIHDSTPPQSPQPNATSHSPPPPPDPPNPS